MAAPKKYPDELRDLATRMVMDARRSPATAVGAIPRISGQLGVHPGTLRAWVRQAKIDAGTRPSALSGDAVRIVQLERELRQLRRANQILMQASALFAAQLGRPSR